MLRLLPVTTGIMQRGLLNAGQNTESSQLTAELVIEALSFGVRLCP